MPKSRTRQCIGRCEECDNCLKEPHYAADLEHVPDHACQWRDELGRPGRLQESRTTRNRVSLSGLGRRRSLPHEDQKAIVRRHRAQERSVGGIPHAELQARLLDYL